MAEEASKPVPISTLFNQEYELPCVNELFSVDVKYVHDEFMGMAHQISKADGKYRVIGPNSMDFTFDGRSPPEGALTFDYKKGDGIPNVHVHSIYQQLAVAAKQTNHAFDWKSIGHLGFVGHAGIFSTFANCVYHPGNKDGNGASGDFKITAANIDNIIYLCNSAATRAVQQDTTVVEDSVPAVDREQHVEEGSKNYRFCLTEITYGLRPPKTIKLRIVAETDGYEGRVPIEKKDPEKAEEDFWGTDENGEMHRSLQTFLKMDISGVKKIFYTFAKDGKLTKMTSEELKKKGTTIQSRGKLVLKNMQFFLAKVLIEVQNVLAEKEGQYCEIEFVRGTERKTAGSGAFTIIPKGTIEGPVLFDLFKATFDI